MEDGKGNLRKEGKVIKFCMAGKVEVLAKKHCFQISFGFLVLWCLSERKVS